MPRAVCATMPLQLLWLLLVPSLCLRQGVGAGPPVDWAAVDKVLTDAIAAHTFPGCAASVTGPDGSIVYARAFGRHTYDAASPPVDFNASLFDMASLSKIVGVTTTAAALYQAGLLGLDTLVCDPSLLGVAFAAGGKGGVAVRNLLLHNAGFPADPSPGYWEPAFGCPATAANATGTPALEFNCSQRIYDAVMNQTLSHPPGAVFLYSDLSFISMLYVVGTVIERHALVAEAAFLPACGAPAAAPPSLRLHCFFEAYWRTVLAPRMGLPTGQYLLAPDQAAAAMPTWEDTEYRHEQLRGVVSDENAYAVGGISGHAGVWCSGNDAARFMSSWRRGPMGGLLNDTTVALWTAVANASFSPRALGWSTNADSYRGCGGMHPSAAYHTGYTGTQLCYDATVNVSTTLLTAIRKVAQEIY